MTAIHGEKSEKELCKIGSHNWVILENGATNSLMTVNKPLMAYAIFVLYTVTTHLMQNVENV